MTELPPRVPRIIWMLWLQGWDKAPALALACLASWRRLNPAWRVQPLDEASLSSFIPAGDLARISASRTHAEAFSDCVRIELLHRYGGVWADATSMCMQPLDEWLESRMHSGFFAFEKPGPDRMLSSWFLAAEKGNCIVRRWRDAVAEYWRDRNERSDYFWFHRLFADVYAADSKFSADWDRTDALSAAHPGHFAPGDERLLKAATAEQQSYIEAPPAPVFKLTFKEVEARDPESFLDRLIEHQLAQPAPADQPSKRLLVTWYGSFKGHGTIGDLLSLESVVTHLVGRGHRVSHATSIDFDIVGAAKVDWSGANPTDYDAVLFVCGPVLRDHVETSALFDRFSERPLIGVGVSLMPADSAQYVNPFKAVLAREGASDRFGDLAVAAPHPAGGFGSSRSRSAIGFALRGAQGEYGLGACLSDQTEQLAGAVRTWAQGRGLRVISIENHLERAAAPPQEIEKAYAECQLVITSRFHGAIAALRQGTPCIALDQIRGGAKVTNLLQDIAHPHVYRTDRMDAPALVSVASSLLAASDPRYDAASDLAVRRANIALSALDHVLSDSASPGRTQLRNDGQREFRFIDPPFHRNAPNVAAYPAEVTGYYLLECLRRRLGWTSFAGRRLLDFGCGVRFARTLYNLDLPIGRYVGVDVDRAMIDWLAENVKDERFQFVRLDAANAMYNPAGSERATDALIRAGVGECDAACMFSVITHQSPDEAELTFRQLRSVVSQGQLYFTAFVDDAVERYTEGDLDAPGHKATYNPSYLIEILERAGWRTETIFTKTSLQQIPFLCTAKPSM